MKTMFILLGVISAAFGSDKSLEELINIGLGAAFEIKNQDLRVEQAKNTFRNSIYSYLPAIELSGGRTRERKESIDSGIVTAETKNSDSLSISANWELFKNFRKITDVRVQDMALDIAGLTKRKAIGEYILKVIEAYFSQQLLYERKKILELRLEQSTWTKSKATEMLNLGAKTKIDVYDSDIEVSNVRRELLEIEFRIKNGMRSLQFLVDPLNAHPVKIIDLKEYSPYFMKKFEGNLAEIRKRRGELLYQRNPDLNLAMNNLEKSRIELAQTKRDFLPAISISAKHDYDLGNVINSELDSANRKGLHATSVSINLTWTMWDWLIRWRNIDNSISDFKIQNNNYTQTRFEKNVELQNLLHQYAVTEQSLQVSKIILNKSVEQNKYSLEMYKLGRLTIFGLQQATNRFVQAQNTYAQRLKDYYTLCSKLLFFYGYDLIPPVEKKAKS